MPFSDPEIDLLREILEEDPDADVLLPLAEELVRRLRWAEAEAVLVEGAAHLAPDDPRRSPAFALLARAALETARYDVAGSALRELAIDPARTPELARVELLVLERSGETGLATEKARAFLAIDPDDVVVTSLVERLSAPTEPPSGRARDPFFTAARAEAYARIGRPDRAARVYRRILSNTTHPGRAAALELRIRQLGVEHRDHTGDDLSEDLTDPGLVPEEPELETDPAGPRPAPPARPPEVGVPHPGLQPGEAWAGDGRVGEARAYEDAPTPVAPTQRATSSAPPQSTSNVPTIVPPTAPALPMPSDETSGPLSEEPDGSWEGQEPHAGLPTATPVPPGTSPHARDRRKRRSLLRR